MLDRPWIRLVLGVLAAAALGALAARVAGSVPGGGAGTEQTAGEDGTGRSGPSDGSRGTGSGGAGRSSGGRTATSADGTERGDATAGSGTGTETAGGGAGVQLTGGSGRLTVHVTGAVRRPGVYRLREGARVYEAVRKAGGAARRADRERLNLAATVRDGQQVLVPERPRRVAAAAGGSGARGGGAAGGAGSGGSARAGAGGASAGGGPPVDLNTASVEELQQLDGVGPTTAEKIVRLREERGGLGGVDDLDEIPGIGPKKLDALRTQLEP